jgi:hypothetical protein
MLPELDVLLLCPLRRVIALSIVQVYQKFNDPALICMYGLLILVIEIDAQVLREPA